MNWWRNLSLVNKMLAAMAIGVALGLIFGKSMVAFKPLGDLFILLLQMVAIPLIFCNLVVSIAKLPDLGTLRRVGIEIMVYYVFTVVTAAVIGILVMTIFHVGTGFQLHGVKAPEVGTMPAWTQVLLNMVPKNAFAAFAEGKLMQIVVFAIFLGVTILLLKPDQKEKLSSFFELFNDLFRRMIMMVMGYAPIGVAFLLAASVGQYGSAFFGPIGKYVGAYYLGAAIQVIIVYGGLLLLLAGYNPLRFLVQAVPLISTTASTCSSLASLPVSMRVADETFKVPERIYGLTLPLGATLSKDGSTMVFTAVAVFAANAMGIHLSFAQLFSLAMMATLISFGGEGIPMAGVVQVAIILPAFGLPIEFAAVFAGIWRITEMAQVTMNCLCDLVGTKIVATLEARRKPLVSSTTSA